MTTTFVIEAMAAANAQLRWKRREQEEVGRVHTLSGRDQTLSLYVNVFNGLLAGLMLLYLL